MVSNNPMHPEYEEPGIPDDYAQLVASWVSGVITDDEFMNHARDFDMSIDAEQLVKEGKR